MVDFLWVVHSDHASKCIKYNLSRFMRCCLNGTASQYLEAHCTTVSVTATRHHLLHSTANHQFVVLSRCVSSYECYAFSAAGLMT